MTDLQITTTPIPGLLVVHMPVHGDNRGWFKENWQREKMTALGLPDFGPVQNNMSFNDARGTTRGIHAEPWDKLVSVAQGRVFGAWVDLREGDSFGATFSIELDESVAVFVPRGVGNSYQTLTDNVTYSYLVNDHWSAGATDEYSYLNLADETAAIAWPIPLSDAEISEKDLAHPRLADARPVAARKTLILGASGQLGRALQQEFPDAVALDRDGLDLTDEQAVQTWPWREYGLVLNAAAYTAVDAAETPEGRRAAWAANAVAPALLARLSLEHRFTLVHVSSDYVFDGTDEVSDETSPLAPLGVYGQSKAAGDLAVQVAPQHYLIRTSWVVGEGRNFIQIMRELAAKGVEPSVVDDQRGRLTHTSTLAAAIAHLVRTGAAFGTYDVTDGGEVVSWADIAEAVFAASGRPGVVKRVSTEEYFAGKQAAPRPLHSALDLTRITAAGFQPPVLPLDRD